MTDKYDKYELEPIEPGLAFGSVIIAGTKWRIPLPGRFTMSTSSPGHWINDVTGIEVEWREGSNDV